MISSVVKILSGVKFFRLLLSFRSIGQVSFYFRLLTNMVVMHLGCHAEYVCLIYLLLVKDNFYYFLVSCGIYYCFKVVTPANSVIVKPDSIGDIEACALAYVACTAWAALVTVILFNHNKSKLRILKMARVSSENCCRLRFLIHGKIRTFTQKWNTRNTYRWIWRRRAICNSSVKGCCYTFLNLATFDCRTGARKKL